MCLCLPVWKNIHHNNTLIHKSNRALNRAPLNSQAVCCSSKFTSLLSLLNLIFHGPQDETNSQRRFFWAQDTLGLDILKAMLGNMNLIQFHRVSVTGLLVYLFIWTKMINWYTGLANLSALKPSYLCAPCPCTSCECVGSYTRQRGWYR